MVYEELLVTVTVAPKSGGLLDGVCQPTLYAAAHAAPVSAGALVAPNVTATVAPGRQQDRQRGAAPAPGQDSHGRLLN